MSKLRKRRWTDAEVLQAIELLSSGNNYREAAQILGRTIRSIQKKNIREWKVGSNKKIRRYTKEEDILAIQLLKEGKTLENVANILGRTKNAVLGRNSLVWKIPAVPDNTNRIRVLQQYKEANPDFQTGCKNHQYGKKNSPEIIKAKTRKILEINKKNTGKTNIEIYGEVRAKQIRDIRSEQQSRWIANHPIVETKPEKIVRELLEKYRIEFQAQTQFKYCVADFYIPSTNLVIFVDGCYWHGHVKEFPVPTKRQKDRIRIDNSQTTYLKNRGYNVVRIWECELQISQLEGLLCVHAAQI